MGIISVRFRTCDTLRIISMQRSLRFFKCDKFLLFVILIIVSCINGSDSWVHQHHQSYGGQFVGEEEAEAIAIETNMRLAKIPCNFTTKTNCIYAEQLKLTLPFKENNEIVVSWVPQIGIANRSDFGVDSNNKYDNNRVNINITKNNVQKDAQNDFYNFNWIFELLACMMLASAFEICLLILRNLRNISLAFLGFWSALNIRLQLLCFTNAASSSVNKTDNMRKRNGAIGEKRTLSYIFAILTWRASQTAKGGAAISEANLRDESTNSAIGYGHVTTMGDLLLLILFTHVYYQRQKFHQGEDNKVNSEPEDLLESHKGNDQSNPAYQKLYDKQNSNNNAFNDSSRYRRGLSKRCSHFCGNMYQQISSLQEHKSPQVKLTPLTTYTTKIPYLTYCTGIVWYTCCFCQYSCRSCCYCCSNCRRWNQRCYIYIPPLCNTIYCCCFYKSLKSFHDAYYQYSCYLCCWQDFCHISSLGPHVTCRCCCHFYCERIHNHCCLCNAIVTNKAPPSRAFNLILLNKIKSCSPNVYRHSVTDYYVWKLKCNNQSYSIFYEVDGQNYSLFYLADGRSMCVYKRSYYQTAIDVFSYLLPQYLVTLKNCQTFLKWKKLHVAVVVMALIVFCASSAGANYDHHHYYSSLFNRCHKHFSKCKQNKRRRRRRRRRHQHCKAYRPQHYFYTTIMSCVKRQKNKKMHKKLVNKLYKKSTKLLTSNTTTYEYTLASTISTTTRSPMVRTIRRVRGSKPNIVWLIIGLIWFEGPKIVNCNVIINYQNQQQHEQQQQQQQHQQTGNNHKETTTTINSVNSNFEYKMDNFNQLKTKNGNNNSNSNSNNNNSSNNNKNKNKNTNNSNNNSNTNNSRSSTTSSNNNIHLSVNLIPIINTIHFKHYCNSNYHQKLIRSSQRVQRALKTNPKNLDTSITSSASLNYNNINDDLDSEQLSSSSSFQNINEENHAQSDLMRLESIKHQILFKLGLTRKPNVSHPLPKQFIWDTIYRADGIKSFHEFSNTNNFQDHQHFMSQQNYPYWSSMPTAKGSNVVPINYQQKQHRIKDRSGDLGDFEEGIDNIKRSLESINVGRKKYGKNKQQQPHQTLYKQYNNDVNYQKGATSLNLNQLLYTSNRNKLNHTNKTVNNFTILKQFKHQQFHKNSQHSTTTGKKTTIHQQQNRRQHEQINQYTNSNSNNNIENNNKNINNNNKNNNNNNVNNSNNNIIVVQKHLRNNNKFIEEEEAKKFTYLTDISSSDDSLNSMEYHNPDFDDNNSIVRKQQQLQQKQRNGIPNEKASENVHNFNINTDDSNVGGVDVDVSADPNIIHDDEDGINEDDDDRYHHHNQHHHHRHENYFPKLDNFDENDDFFGSTQEIITFAEKGKMYKNHRLVEFSHQNNEKPKQKLRVRNAEIHIRIDKNSIKNKSRAGSGIKRKRLKIWIFQLIENNYTHKGFDHAAQFCASFEVDTSRLGWKKFDITSTVKEWYSRREGEKLRLLIDCTGCGKMYTVHLFNGNNPKADASVRERRIADERRNTNINDINSKNFFNVTHNSENFTNFPFNQTIMVKDARRNNEINAVNPDEEDLMNSSRPFLVLHTEARRQRRVRRRAINCNGALHGQCCKESFYVSFKALGWDDWIIAPRGYFANYCRGDCTGPYRTPDTFQTFHAHFIEEYRKMGLLNGMQPCCAPIKFSSMSLIYYGDEGIIKRDLPKMVVDECGCP